MNGIVYKITNMINGKAYVGITIRKIERRISAHFAEANRGSDLIIHRALKKYGIDCFSYDIIEKNKKWEELCELEKYYIKYFNCKKPNGYNLTDGGEGILGYKWTDEQRNNHYLKTPEGKEKNDWAKRPENRQWFSENNPSKSPEVKEKQIASARKNAPNVEIDGIVYSCIPDAAEKLGISCSQARNAAKRGVLKTPPDKLKKDRRERMPNVTIDGITYSCIPEASERLGITYGQASYGAKKGTLKDKRSCEGYKNHNSKQVTIDNIIYNSIGEYAEIMGITYSQAKTAAKKGTLKVTRPSGDKNPSRRPEVAAKISAKTKGVSKSVGINNHKAIPIVIDCVVYEYKKQAMEELGISFSVINKMIEKGEVKFIDKDLLFGGLIR